MVRPRVLVMLACFNGAPWIAEQITSILSQEEVDVDLIIGDDGSTDNTILAVTPFLNDPRVRLVSSALPTGAAGQNFFSLIRNTPTAGYDFFAFADQDDIWCKEKICEACTALRHSSASGYSSSVTAAWEAGREIILRQESRLTNSDFLFEGAGQGCSFVMAASFYEEVREFVRANSDLTKDLYFHDWAVYALARSWGRKWIFDRRSFIRYRQHETNDTGARASISGIIKRFKLLKRGWYRRQLLAICNLCRAANQHDPVVATWHELLALPRSASRKLRMIQFCLRAGRRRCSDNAILVGAISAGWV